VTVGATLLRAAVLGLALLSLGCADDLRAITGQRETPREEAERALKTLSASADGQARADAARALGRLKPPEAPAALIPALRDQDPRVRKEAAAALAGLSDAAPQSVPALRAAAAAEPEGAPRVEMAWTLKKLRAPAPDWAPPFRASLGDPQDIVRYNAALGLVGQREATPEIFPVLWQVIGTEFEQSLLHGPRAAGIIADLAETQDRRLVPPLLQGLERGTPPQRAAAAAAIARFDPAPPPAVPLLTQLLRHPDAKVRDAAATGLYRISLKAPARASAPALAELLRDPDPGVRRSAAGALRLVDNPRVAVPALIPALGDPVPEMRREAAFVLGELRGPAQDAVPALTALFQRDPSGEVRVSACRALSKLAPRAREAAPALREALRDADPAIRDCAADTLQRLEIR